MGNSTSCCPKENLCDMLWDEEKIIHDNFEYKKLIDIVKIIKIQSYFRGLKFRKNFNFVKYTDINPTEVKSTVNHLSTNELTKFTSADNLIKRKKSKNKEKSTPIGFADNLRPGDLITEEEFDKIETNPKVADIEEKIGNFIIEEKEILRHLEDYKYKLKKLQLRYKNGSVYIGYLDPNWQREGYGILIHPDGSKYEGLFKNNQYSGKGRLIKPGGDYYEGEYEENKANGFGKLVNKNGGIYLGYFKNDKQHGKGEEIFIDGSRYEGIFSHGAKHGTGKTIWADGSTYEGEFSNNNLEGYGIYKWKDGRVYQGEWKRNKMEGLGFFVWPDRKKYFGQYKNDAKNGYGIFVWAGGKKYEGEWQNGKQNGYGIFTFSNRKKFGLFKNGQKDYWVNIDENYAIYQKILFEINKLTQNMNYHRMINTEDTSLTGST